MIHVGIRPSRMTPGVLTALARWAGPLSVPMKNAARRMISADSAMPVWPHRLL